jgi:uncharacterized protein (TIGR02271 family)
MQHTLIAVFDNRRDAEHAQDELLATGFARQDVKISRADATGQTDSLTGRPGTVAPETEDEGIGASIRHFFRDIFGTDNSPHAQKYTDAVSRGHHVLTVTAADEPEVERAADIVEKHGPVDIDEKAAEWAGGAPIARPESMRASGAGGLQQSAGLSAQSGTPTAENRALFQQQSLQDETPMGSTYQEPQPGGGNLSAGTTRAGSLQGGSMQGSALEGSAQTTAAAGASLQRDTGVSGETAIPVVEERIKVGKRAVQRGGVRVYSRLVETPVDESIGLREEHVNIERHKLDQPVGTADTTVFKEQQIEVRETAEEPVVEKSARVVEEVVVGKKVTERQEHIHDTLRHTEVQVEQLSAGADVLDEDYFRRDWQSRYGKLGGSYEDYAPAYGFGAQAARSALYRGRPWNEIESDLRTGWESRYGASGQPSTWDRFKDAVRSGWDRMTGGSGLDEDYRRHWSTHFATSGAGYDEYLPAYRFGYDMAGNDKYRGRPWDQVESDLRSDWDARYGGGASTWERFKAAVRHGWDRMSGDEEYRRDWSSRYATTGGDYDEYAPAYRYGYDMASSDKYRGRAWNDVESDLRSDWDTRHGGAAGSTWERFKAAVHHGWDRVSS